MSGLIEKREYYEDRTLKSIYFVDENGNKQGTKTTYSSYNGAVICTEEYSDDKLDGSVKKYGQFNGEVYQEEIYEKGVLKIHRETDNGRLSLLLEYENGQLVHKKEHRMSDYEDMYYKDGKEYNGSVRRYRGTCRDDEKLSLKYSLVDGKYDGHYYGEGIDAHYDKGVLHGDYEDGKRKGKYDHGKFTGVVDCRAKAVSVSTFFNHERILSTENWVDGEVESVHLKSFVKKGDIGTYEAVIRSDGECWESEFDVIECVSHEVKYTRKNGKIDGLLNELHPKGWVMKSTEYKEGKPHGASVEYNSDGTIASKRIFRDGVDITDNLERLKRFAKGNVSGEQGVILPKRSKLSKVTAMLKDRLSGNSGQ